MLRDVDENRQHEDKKDQPGKRAVHKRILNRRHASRWALSRSRASRISRSKAVSPGIAGVSLTCVVAGIAAVGGPAASAALSISFLAVRDSSRSWSGGGRR